MSKIDIGQDERNALIKSISCPICKNYAWHTASQTPMKDKYEGFHHPACVKVSRNQ